jgi:hypothetical protein
MCFVASNSFLDISNRSSYMKYRILIFLSLVFARGTVQIKKYLFQFYIYVFYAFPFACWSYAIFFFLTGFTPRVVDVFFTLSETASTRPSLLTPLPNRLHLFSPQKKPCGCIWHFQCSFPQFSSVHITNLKISDVEKLFYHHTIMLLVADFPRSATSTTVISDFSYFPLLQPHIFH